MRITTLSFRFYLLMSVLSIFTLHAQNNYAIEFDGENDVVDFGESLIVTEDFTYELDIFSRNEDGGHHGFLGFQGEGRAPSMWVYNTTQIHYGFTNQSGDWVNFNSPEGTITPFVWHHIALVKEGTELRLYVDDVLIETQDVGESVPNGQPTRHLGRVDNFFYGMIDNVRIFDAAVEEATLSEWLYTDINDTHPNYDVLLGAYLCNEGEGTATADLTENQPNGSLEEGANFILRADKDAEFVAYLGVEVSNFSSSENIDFEFSNRGSVFISDVIEAHLYVDDASIPYVGTYDASVDSIAPGASATMTFEGVDISAPNQHDLLAVLQWQGDQINDNDSISTSIRTLAFLAENNVLLEEYTATWCGSCTDAMAQSQALDDSENIQLIRYHIDDPLTNEQCYDVIATHNGELGFWMVDRRRDGNNMVYTPANGGEEMLEAFDAPKELNITVERDFDWYTRELNVTVTAEAATLLTDSIGLNCYVLIDGIQRPLSPWAQSNNFNLTADHPYESLGDPIFDFEHRHVFHYAMNGLWGDEEALPTMSAFDTHSRTFSYTLPAGIDPEQIHLVGMAQRMNEDHRNRSVMNSNGIALNPNDFRLAVDLSAVAFDAYEQDVYGAGVAIPLVIENMGATDFAEVFEVQVDLNGEIVTQAVDWVEEPLASGERRSIDLSGLDLTAIGQSYLLTANLIVDGDAYSENDALSGTFYHIGDSAPEQSIVLERPNSENNSSSLVSDLMIEAIAQNHPAVIPVSLHRLGEFETDEAEELKEYYKFSWNEATLNRRNIKEWGTTDYIKQVSEIDTMIAGILAKPSIVDLQMNSELSEDASELTIIIEAQFLAPVSNEQRFNLYLLEDVLVDHTNLYGSIPDFNHPVFDELSNPIPEYESKKIFREALGGTWGTELSLPAPDDLIVGESYSYTYTIDLNATDLLDINSVYALGMVQSYGESENDRAIQNARIEKLTTEPPVGTQELLIENASVIIYPNPTADQLFIRASDLEGTAKVTLYDMMGKVCKSFEIVNGTLSIPVSDLANGMYQMQIRAAQQSVNSRLLIQR